MKITNQTIQIIAQSIWDDLFKSASQKYEADRKKKEDSIKLDKNEQKLVDQYESCSSELNRLGKKYKERYYYSVVNGKEVGRELLSRKKSYAMTNYPKCTVPTVAEVVSTVTLATVDASDLKGLIAAVKAKYKVK